MRRSLASLMALTLSAPAAVWAQTSPQPEGEASPSAATPATTAETPSSDAPAPTPHPDDAAPTAPTPPPADLLDRIAQSFVLHGNFRVRPELQHNFAIGWDAPALAATAYNNSGWPWSRNPGNGIAALCSTSPLPGTSARVAADCLSNYQTMANMRLRLQPEIHVTDSITVHTQIDIFDNFILGSTPEGGGVGRTQDSSPWAPITAMSQTQVTPTAQNSLVPSIAVSRAWAEVTNATLGQIRFGSR